MLAVAPLAIVVVPEPCMIYPLQLKLAPEFIETDPAPERVPLVKLNVPFTSRSVPVPSLTIKSEFSTRVAPDCTIVSSVARDAVTVTVFPLVMVMVAALLSGESVAGLTTPDEKSDTGELSHVPIAFQFPEVIDLK